MRHCLSISATADPFPVLSTCTAGAEAVTTTSPCIACIRIACTRTCCRSGYALVFRYKQPHFRRRQAQHPRGLSHTIQQFRITVQGCRQRVAVANETGPAVHQMASGQFNRGPPHRSVHRLSRQHTSLPHAGHHLAHCQVGGQRQVLQRQVGEGGGGPPVCILLALDPV